MLARDHLYPDPSRLVTFIGNHDMLRFMNETGATTAGLKLAQTFIMTTRGMPQIYYGDEIAIRGGGDPDNRRGMPGAFPGDARDAFTVEGRTPEEQDVFVHLRRVIHLRQELEPLRRGSLQQLYVADQQYAFARTTSRESVLVAINNDTRPATWTVNVEGTGLADGTRLQDRLDVIGTVTVEKGRVALTVPARAAAILTK